MAGATGVAGAAGSAGMMDCTPPVAGSHGQNPLFTDQFTADPAPFVHDCTFYIQCGHDEAAAGQNSFVMKEWFLLASTDMVHWTKTVTLKLSDFSWADANAWAGQMVTKGGKFYWYVPVNERGSGMALAVAVADSPTGPFKDALGKPLVDDAFEMSNMGFRTPSDTPFTIDPTVFVDDDGQAYLHYGGFSRLIVAKLGSDMTSIDGKMQEVTPQGFFEAAFLIKHGGKYYEIYAAGSNPATIDYATSSSPLGPWKYGGRVMDAFPKAAGQQDAPTNHSGVAELNGQWYIVYHTSSGPNGGGTYRREVAIDKLTFNSDGTIQKVAPSSGLSF
jgi:beta-xylosidase